MNFISKPNLPEKSVKFAVVDSRVEKSILHKLKTYGCDTILVPKDINLSKPINSHADIHILHLGKEVFLTSKNFNYCFNEEVGKVCEEINNRRVPKNLYNEYPGDVLLNAAIVGNYIICNTKTVTKELLSTEKEIIHTNQGYTKCSVAIVSENAIITDDSDIYKKCKDKLDVCLVEKNYVKLNGYNYGFIGGSCGKISKNKLAFFGDINQHINADTIINFCYRHNVECVSLSNSPLYDYGSLIPIIEE